jgi:glycosyltransferase involved in cell wall biosynthesis/tetratricopeptide (TPR) repeat protein
MADELFGKTHQALLERLAGPWKSQGPPVCFLEGFPGVGKSNALVRHLRMRLAQDVKAVSLDLPEPGAAQADDLLLRLAQELDLAGIPDVAKALDEGQDLYHVTLALQSVLAQPVLVVWDEFQRALDPQTGEPFLFFKQLLNQIGNRAEWHGRLLLLTNRNPHRGQWSDSHCFLTVPNLDSTDGLIFLDHLLHEANREAEIPPMRRPEIVSWVGGNPRALKLVVSALAGETLENLIGLIPETWELRDREVSPLLIEDLERELLRKILEQLDSATRRVLSLIAVFRQPIKRDVLDRLAPPNTGPEHLRRELVDRHLLDHHHGSYTLNRIAQEVLKRTLQADPVLLKFAHRLAGAYYARAFRGIRIIGGGGRLGGNFVEARYHLVQAGREEELTDIALRFADHLQTEINWTSRIPSDPQELAERIAVLSALLESPGPEELEYHLARCLTARRQGEDLERALEHARKATDTQSHPSAWALRLRLESEIEGAEAVLKAALEGLQWVTDNGSLYQAGADALLKTGELDEALELLYKGIERVSPENGLTPLYYNAVEILKQKEKLNEAVLLLLQGIERVPPEKGLASLYESAAKILIGQEKLDEASLLLLQGIERVPPEKGLASLYESAAKILIRKEKLDEAVVLLRQGIERVPPEKNLAPLYQSAAEILVRQGKLDDAIALLREGIKTVPEKSSFSLYQMAAETLGRSGCPEQAVKLLRQGITEIPKAYNRYKLVENALYISAAACRVDLIEALLANQSNDSLDNQSKALGKSLQLQAGSDWTGAAETARLASKEFPTYFHLVIQEAFCWLCADQPEEAASAFDKFPWKLQDEGNPASWLRAFISLRLGDLEGARAHYSTYLGRSPEEVDIPTAIDLLRLWDSPVPFSTPHPAYYHPTLPPNLTSLLESTTRPPSKESVLPRNLPEKKRSLQGSTSYSFRTVLAVATEWSSQHGGLSTLNRELCIALAKAGHRVACVVPAASEEEVENARSYQVLLVPALAVPGADALAPLFLRPPLPEGYEPDLVLGHGRITGPTARALATNFFHTADRIHMVHMAPGEIEWLKENPGAAARSEDRERLELELAMEAALVSTVGPRLYRETANLLGSRPSVAPRVHRLDPGIRPGAIRQPPTGIQVLVLGRVEDRLLKGLDIAARAMAALPHPHPRPFEADPILVVRGAPVGTGDELWKQLREIARVPGDRLRIREYTADVERITEDLNRSSLLLMASRVEGFGLVGLEAIAAGTPVLVSDRSGLGELLLEQLGPAEAASFVVRVEDDLEADAREWARAIEAVLRDRKAAFRRAEELRTKLSAKLSWGRAVASLLEALESARPATERADLA